MVKPKICSNEPSIVISGPICNTPGSEWTHKTCESARTHFPGAEIVLSTWKDSDVSGLDYDVLVENEDPGELEEIREIEYRIDNLNRMICAVVAGLKKASRKYVIRIRTDMYFTSADCLKYWGIYRNFTPAKVVSERVVTLPTVRRLEVFHPSDFFAVGLKDDVLLLWDAQLINDNNSKYEKLPLIPWDERYATGERYVYLTFLCKGFGYKSLFEKKTVEEAYCVFTESFGCGGKRAFRKPKNLEQLQKVVSDMSMADNLVTVNQDLLGVDSLKYPGYWNCQFINSRFEYYAYNEWKKLYNRYCGGKTLTVFPLKQYLIYIFMLFGNSCIRSESFRRKIAIALKIKKKKKK